MTLPRATAFSSCKKIVEELLNVTLALLKGLAELFKTLERKSR
jgi:hypothetical protein